jgi:transcriptional regulator with XRE-family HTH domain
MNYLPSIDLDIAERLRDDAEFRQAYFLAESSGMIARQLIRLRKRRGLSQTEVAKQLDTRQPAISRVESADYRNWSFNTLRRLAEAMDARLRVIIEPSEDILSEYEEPKAEAEAKPAAKPSQAAEFNRWLTHDNPYSAPLRRSPRQKIIEDADSAATSGDPIGQQPTRSLLDEQDESKMNRQNAAKYDDMAGAICS